MEGSEIDSIKVESGLLSPNATYEALSGNHYNGGIRASISQCRHLGPCYCHCS